MHMSLSNNAFKGLEAHFKAREAHLWGEKKTMLNSLQW